MSYDQKLKDLELLQGDLQTADDFAEVFEDLSLDREFWTDPQRCAVAKHLMFRQGEFLGGELGKEALKMEGPGNH